MNWISSKFLSVVFIGWLAAFWFSFLLCSPVPDTLGNRQVAVYPARKAVLSSEWSQAVSTWIVERSPFRYGCIVNRNFAVYSTARALPFLPLSPGHDSVAMGRKGWLFYAEDSRANRSLRSVDRDAERAVDLARLVTKSGRRFCLLNIPDKSVIYREYTGPMMRWMDQDSYRSQVPPALTKAFRKAPDVGQCYLPLWEHFEAHKPDGLLYWEQDTHWNRLGMIIATRLLVEHLQPGLWEPESEQNLGIQEKTQDLGEGYLLLPLRTIGPNLTVVRPGANPVQYSSTATPGYPAAPMQSFRCNHPKVIKGRTVVIGDSFLLGAPPVMIPWFEEITFAHYDQVGSPELATALSASDTLIFGSVQRIFHDRIDKLTNQRRDYLEKAMPPR